MVIRNFCGVMVVSYSAPEGTGSSRVKTSASAEKSGLKLFRRIETVSRNPFARTK
jgi:hypothetical protein